jgi:CRP/FNR family cyclic AMP-dependent transcriptional regulator
VNLSISLLMSDFPLFQSLMPDECDIVEKKMAALELKRGTVVYKEGEHGKSMCFVVDGKVDVIKKDAKGAECVVASLGKGQSVGEMALIDGMIRSATIRASTEATIVVLKRDSFEQLLQEHPVIGIKILKELARSLSASLRRSSDQITKLTLTS